MSIDDTMEFDDLTEYLSKFEPIDLEVLTGYLTEMGITVDDDMQVFLKFVNSTRGYAIPVHLMPVREGARVMIMVEAVGLEFNVSMELMGVLEGKGILIEKYLGTERKEGFVERAIYSYEFTDITRVVCNTVSDESRKYA
tara:strand:+ start:865 stop:1284 length:420 start_codon:yes stop_codon:yes gene_type:complete